MDSGSLNIGAAAEVSGVSAKMIRHYEAIGLIPKVRRTASDYRIYSGNDVHMLRFIRHARDLGFAMAQIAELLRLWRDQRRPSREVKHVALAHIAALERKIGELQAMKASLEHLTAHCHGDERPECPILDDLAAPRAAAASSRGADGKRDRR
jgi:Cu(I)-responsive transcriptional regulator